MKLVMLVAVAGCYSTAPVPATAPPDPAPRAVLDAESVADLCPLGVPSAVVRVQELEIGLALEFTTSGDVADVRRRTRLMADVRDDLRDEIARTKRSNQTLHAAERYVEDVEGGARIVFLPPHATDLHAYRLDLDAEAMRLRGGDCPMVMPQRPGPESGVLVTAQALR